MYGTNHMLLVTNGESAKPNPWDYQANYVLPTALTKDKTYVITLEINAVNGGETRVVTSVDGASPSYLDTKGLWTNKFTKYQIEFKANAAINKLEIDLGACAGEVYFDNVSLVEKGETENMIANGDFETDDLTGWSSETGSALARVEKEAPSEVLEPGMLISVGEAGWRTFRTGSSIKITDPNVKAYVAKYVEEGNYIKLKEVTGIPGWQSVLIEAAPGNYMVEITTEDLSGSFPWGDNGLKANGGSALDAKGGNYYGLGKKNGVVGFYKISDAVPAWKIYMEIPSSAAPEFVSFGGTTGIEAVKVVKSNGEFFNLAGQRVANPTKGLYIVNGKKVVLK